MYVTAHSLRCAALAAGLVAVGFGSARAGTYVWRGGTDANWSTSANWSPTGVPGASDSVVFDAESGSAATVVDAAFGGKVTDFTLEAGFSGSVTLQRTFTVQGKWTQTAGTFTAGDFDVRLGDKVGEMLHTGGTINAPSGSFVWHPAHTKHYVDAGGTWNANGGTFVLEKIAGGCSAYLDCTNLVFHNFSVLPGATANNGYIYYSSTNTVAGKFTQKMGQFRGASVSRPGAMIVNGDLEFGGLSDGGDLNLVLLTADDQVITVGDTGSAPSLVVRKPTTAKVSVTGGTYTHHYVSTFTYHNGITVESGEIDFSGAQAIMFNGRHSRFWFEDAAKVTFPQKVTVGGIGPRWYMNGRTFKDLTFTFTQTSAGMPILDGTTNTVTGTLTLGGDGLAAAVAYTKDDYSGWSKPGMNTFSTTAGRADQSRGVIEVKGDMVLTGRTSYRANSCTYLLNGEGPQTVMQCDTNGLPRMIVDKPADSTLTFRTEIPRGFFFGNGGTTYFEDVWLKSGIFDFSACPSIVIAHGSAVYSCLVQTGGKLITDNVPLVCDSSNQSCTWRLSLKDPIYRLEFLAPGTSPCIDLLSSTLTVTNGVVLGSGQINSGTLNVQGDMTIRQGRGSAAGGVTVRFSGDAEQRFENEGGQFPLGTPALVVDKSGGELTIAGDIDVSLYGSRSLVFTNGVTVIDGATVKSDNGSTQTILWPTATLAFRNGGRLIGGDVALKTGATLQFDLSAPLGEVRGEGGANEPLLTAKRCYYAPENLNLEVLPKVTPESPSKYNLVSWVSLSGDPAKTEYDYVLPPVVTHPAVSKDTTEKLMYFSWRYRRGMAVLVK